MGVLRAERAALIIWVLGYAVSVGRPEQIFSDKFPVYVEYQPGPGPIVTVSWWVGISADDTQGCPDVITAILAWASRTVERVLYTTES